VIRQTFRLLCFFFISTSVQSLDINEAYLEAKDNIQEGEIYKIEKFYFSNSIFKVNHSEIHAYRVNKIRATGNFFMILFNRVNWPDQIPLKLRKELWNHYLTQTKLKFELKGITKVDEGRIGDYVFTVLGINIKNQNLEKTRYEEIINSIR